MEALGGILGQSSFVVFLWAVVGLFSPQRAKLSGRAQAVGLWVVSVIMFAVGTSLLPEDPPTSAGRPAQTSTEQLASKALIEPIDAKGEVPEGGAPVVSPEHPSAVVDAPSESANPEPAQLTSAWENSPGLREWVTEWGRLLGVYQSNLRFSEERLQRMLSDVAAADNPEEVTEAVDSWGCGAWGYLKFAQRAYLDGGWWLDQIPVGVDPVSFEQRFRVNRLQFAETGETLTAKLDDVTRQLAEVPGVECPDVWGAWMNPEQRKEQRKAKLQRFFDDDEFRDWLERDGDGEGELEAFRQKFYAEFGEFPK